MYTFQPNLVSRVCIRFDGTLYSSKSGTIILNSCKLIKSICSERKVMSNTSLGTTLKLLSKVSNLAELTTLTKENTYFFCLHHFENFPKLRVFSSSNNYALQMTS